MFRNICGHNFTQRHQSSTKLSLEYQYNTYNINLLKYILKIRSDEHIRVLYLAQLTFSVKGNATVRNKNKSQITHRIDR